MIKFHVLSALVGGVMMLTQITAPPTKPNTDWLPPVSSGPVSPYADEVKAEVDDVEDGNIVSPYAKPEVIPTPVPDDEPDRPTTMTAPQVCECKCECDCPDSAAMRLIVREEVEAALVRHLPKLTTSQTSQSSSLQSATQSTASVPAPSNASTGGSVTSTSSSGYGSSGGSVTSITYGTPIVTYSSNGSSGGSVSVPMSSSGYYSAPPVYESPASTNVRARDRWATPFKNLSGHKVTIHKYASGKHCPACESWLQNVAPKLIADGCMVTELPDLPDNATAPQIDVCKDNMTCTPITGAASYATIVSMLR